MRVHLPLNLCGVSPNLWLLAAMRLRTRFKVREEASREPRQLSLSSPVGCRHFKAGDMQLVNNARADAGPAEVEEASRQRAQVWETLALNV